MAKLSKKSRRPEAPAPAVAPAPRVAPRRKTADQRLRILERLTSGLSIMHIARVEKLTVRRVQQIIAAMLESREIDPPAGFVQLQVLRLSEAMIVTRTMMMEGDLQAVDRMIKLTRELDRYHGFAQAQIPAPPAPPPPRRLAAPEQRPQLTNSTREDEEDAKFSASQSIEIAQNRETISETAPPPEPPPPRRLAAPAPQPQLTNSTREDEADAKFSASQSIEIARNRETISETSLSELAGEPPPPAPRGARTSNQRRHDRACPGHPRRQAAGKASDWPEPEPRG
jgi:hypothetical protein